MRDWRRSIVMERIKRTYHGMTGSPTWRAWVAMRQRCYDPRTHGFKYYGGSGVTVCERWMRFDNFLADMGRKPSGKTLDRFPDRSGNYCSSNCRWATWRQQAINRKPRALRALVPSIGIRAELLKAVHETRGSLVRIAMDAGLTSPSIHGWLHGRINQSPKIEQAVREFLRKARAKDGKR